MFERSASSSIMQVGVSSRRERSFQTKYGIRLMLAPRSAKALHALIPEISHGMRNRPGSPSFLGKLFRMTARHILGQKSLAIFSQLLFCFRVAFSRRLSSFLREGNGIDVRWLGIGALTGGNIGSEVVCWRWT
ncbi:hypothetical protein Tco_0315711 [Tanacetum coccineum]